MNKAEGAAIRFLLTGGNAEDGITPSYPNFFILTEQVPQYPVSHYTKGVKLMLHEFKRELPQAKTTSYITAIRLAEKAKKENAFDILYHYKDKILEGTRTNFFIIKENKLITASEDILPGITRKVIIELAKGTFDTEERSFTLNELEQADEAFITGTSKKVMPVTRINNITIGNGEVGKNTKILMDLFKKYTRVS